MQGSRLGGQPGLAPSSRPGSGPCTHRILRQCFHRGWEAQTCVLAWPGPLGSRLPGEVLAAALCSGAGPTPPLLLVEPETRAAPHSEAHAGDLGRAPRGAQGKRPLLAPAQPPSEGKLLLKPEECGATAAREEAVGDYSGRRAATATHTQP